MYNVSIDDNHGHTASYEASYEIDAALLAAAKNATANDPASLDAYRRVVGLCFTQSKAAVSSRAGAAAGGGGSAIGVAGDRPLQSGETWC
jgi:hypothetical protein